MEQNQPKKHHDAEQEFQASLEQLEDILQEDSTEEEAISKTSTNQASEVADNDNDIDLAALEDAVADIENYLEEITKSK